MRLAAAALVVVVACNACSYGPPTTQVRVRNVALSPDGGYLAVIVHAERQRQPRGLAAFPDGGTRKVLDQRADLYVVALGTRSLVFQGSVPGPRERWVSFAPWLVGWTDGRVFFQITGCPELPRSACQSHANGRSLYAYTVGGAITAVATADGARLLSRIADASTSLSAGAEPYGVSLARAPGSKRRPLLRFAGERLVAVDPGDTGSAFAHCVDSHDACQ